MTILRALSILAISGTALLASAAHAQPQLLRTSDAQGITGDGNTTIGTILDPNNYRIMTFTRGSGVLFLGTQPSRSNATPLISDDRATAAVDMFNGYTSAYWPASTPAAFGPNSLGALCCVASTCSVVSDPTTCTGTVIYRNSTGLLSCTPSPCPITAAPADLGACCNPSTFACTYVTKSSCTSPNYWMSVAPGQSCGVHPCPTGHTLPFRWTQSDNLWHNCGSFPNNTGQSGLGAAKSAGDIAHVYGLSSSGRYLVGTSCYGPFAQELSTDKTRGYVYDSTTAAFTMLPISGTGCGTFQSDAQGISTDGAVVLGNEAHFIAGDCSVRAAAVWERNPTTGVYVQTFLDVYGGGGLGTTGVINRAGTIVAGRISAGAATYVLGDPAQTGGLFRYVRVSAGNWTRTNLGIVPGSSLFGGLNMVPTAIADNGNTIVGTYNGGSFIWRPTLNGGVPMDLNEYTTSLNGGTPLPLLTALPGISADGNAILVSIAMPPVGTGCQNDFPERGVLYLDGSAIPCEQPRIVGPFDIAEREYSLLGLISNIYIFGSHPLTLQWQKETPAGSNNWVTLSDSCGANSTDPVNPWSYEGTTGVKFRVNSLAPPAVRDGNYRVIATNACGTATSAVAHIAAVTGACCWFDGSTGGTACTLEIYNRCVGSTAIPYYLGGVYRGDGTTCSPDPDTACSTQIGACCYYAGGPIQCVADIAPHCTLSVAGGGFGGVFVASQACTPSPCAAVTGACCYSVGGSGAFCTIELSAHCTLSESLGGLSGAYAGNSAACGPADSCPATPGIGACCFNPALTADTVCSVQPSAHCTGQLRFGGLQGTYMGDSVACTVSNCKPSATNTLGACCFTDPNNSSSGIICIVQNSANCLNYPDGSNDANTAPFTAGLGGNFASGQCCQPSAFEPIAGCSTSTNCGAAAGACIASSFNASTDAICTIQVRQTRCERPFNAGGLFGKWVAGVATCSPTVVAANAGACCYKPSGATCSICTIQPQTMCTQVGNGGLSGTFGGLGTACTPTPACVLAQGACCISTSCLLTCAADCTTNAGVYSGNGSSCSPVNPCLPPSGVCCRGATCNASVLQADCTAAGTAGALYITSSTTCNTGGSNTHPCCHADFNKNHTLEVQDIFDFLNAWFAGSRFAITAGNGAGGTLAVQNIFDFLNAWFAGGC